MMFPVVLSVDLSGLCKVMGLPVLIAEQLK